MKDDVPEKLGLRVVDASFDPLHELIQSDCNSIVVAPDIDAQFHEVHKLLKAADKDQERVTSQRIEAGRRLWKIKDECKAQKRRFKDEFRREFPDRERSTVREYMTLARKFDRADAATKVQLIGLFKRGWSVVLGEIRRLERDERIKKRKSYPNSAVDRAEDLKLVLGDCMVRLRGLPDENADCVIVSIPYYRRVVFSNAMTVFGGDRSCAHDWETRQVERTLSLPRTAWINRPNRNSKKTIESGTCRMCGAEKVMLGWEEDQAKYIDHVVQICNEVKRVLKPHGVFWLNIDDSFGDQGLRLIPHRLAPAISDSGWICRSEHIWHVQGRAPDGAIDRATRNHENLFMFVKQKDYYFDQSILQKRGLTGTVWSFPNERVEGHQCPFPKALIEPLVLSSCPEGGVCLDPMAGSGTTGLVALAHGRKAILIEANPDYCELAKQRINTELGSYKNKLAQRQKPTHGVVSRRRH